MGISNFFSGTESKKVVRILYISLLVRILLSLIQGYSVDLATFAAWFRTAADYSPRFFYDVSSFSDYPPFNIYIFWIFGSIAKFFNLFNKRAILILLKLPPNLFDIATGILIYRFLRKKFPFEKSLSITAFYIFNPAIIFNTSIWGQYDAIYTFFLVLTLILILDAKIEYSIISYTVGVLTKPQSIALAPLIVFLILKEKGWKGWVTSGLISAATTLVLILPFRWNNPLEFLIDIYLTGYSGYPYTSVNAFNFWAFHGFWESDGAKFLGLDFFYIGWLLFGALAIFSLYQISKRLSKTNDIHVFFTAFILLFGFFMLPTRIHERYLFPAFSVLALTIPFIPDMKKMFSILSLTYLLNQAVVLFYLNRGEYLSNRNPLVLIVSTVNLIVFLFGLKNLYSREFSRLH